MTDQPQHPNPFIGVGVGAVNRLKTHVPPATLYHYTTGTGLEGILKGHSFWMTDIRYMNDASEGVYGLAKLTSLADKFLADKGENAQNIGQRVLAELGRFAVSQSLAACCFCKKPDLLTQWRAYGGGQIAYSIEVSTAGLLQSSNFQPLLLEVIYDEREQEELLLDGVTQLFNLAGSIPSDQPEARIAQLITEAAYELHFILYFLKHPAFESEQEFRLTLSRGAIHNYGVAPKVRNTPLGFAPYYEWRPTGGKLPITGIKVGPTGHQGHAVEGLLALIETTDYKGLPLLPPSLIPLR